VLTIYFNKNMDAIYAQIEIENLFTKRCVAVKALVDLRTVFLTIPEHVALQLGFDLSEASTREVVLANSHRQEAPMIGPLRGDILNRPEGRCFQRLNPKQFQA
jgi:hypothetical protein